VPTGRTTICGRSAVDVYDLAMADNVIEHRVDRQELEARVMGRYQAREPRFGRIPQIQLV
jgi:hypothetical protein